MRMSSGLNIIFLLNKKSILLFTFVMSIVILCTGKLTANVQCVDASLVVSKSIETNPGRIVAASVLISTTSTGEEKFVDSLDLPDGWQAIVPNGSTFDLKSGEKTVRFISFRVPATSPAGQYEVSYAVKSMRNSAVNDKVTLAVRILSVYKLESIIEEKPDNVIAGNQYKAHFKVINKGNAATKIRLEIKSSPLYHLELTPAYTTLAPGASENFQLTVKTDEKSREGCMNVVRIKAYAADVQDGSVFVDRSFIVKVYAKITGTYDPYIRIPTVFSFMNLRDNSRKGLQWVFSGSGSLDEEGKKQIDFLFRAPDLQPISTYGLRDEYRLRYSDPDTLVLLGDQVYSLTPLLEDFQYGRGACVAFRKKQWEYGAYTFNTRWLQPAQKESALFLGYRFNDSMAIRGNYLSKSVNLSATPSAINVNQLLPSLNAIGTAKLASLKADFRPLRNFICEVEYGLCNSNKDIYKNAPNNAYQVRVEGQFKGDISVSLNKIYAGPRFFGYYNDSDYTFGTINFPLFKKLRSYFTYRSTKDNLAFDITRRYANFQQSYIFGTSYYFSSGLNLSLEYEDYKAKDLLPPADSNFSTQKLRCGIGKQMGSFTVQSYIDRGRLSNYMQNSFMPLDRVALSLSFNPSSYQTFSIYTTNGYDSFYLNPGASTTTGVSTSISFGERIRFGASYGNTISQPQQVTQNMTGSLSYSFKDKSSLDLWGYKRRGADSVNNESTLFLSYSIPFGIPVGKKKSIGILRGRVYDEDTERSPLSGVVLMAGAATAVTDKKGEYIFPSLKPGQYMLSIEKTSMGVKRIATVKMPMTIDIKGGDTVIRNIAVTTGCRLSGRVMLYAETSTDKKENDKEMFIKRPGEKESDTRRYMEKSGVVAVIIELSNGEEVFRQYTDEYGKFYFSGIPPGTWTLKANSADLPELTYLEKDADTIELRAGEDREYNFRVLPRKRVIKIIDTGPIKKMDNKNKDTK
ncbi:MAG: hypothetical protein AB9903_31555 [Vulcanimicrobiota bacterium]